MLILIPKLLFSIPNPKFICGEILAKKVKIITFMITFMILFSPSRLHDYDWGTLYLMFYLCFVSLYYYRKKKSKLFVLPENWHTEYLEDADSYSDK